jgi:hypothetical protein
MSAWQAWPTIPVPSPCANAGTAIDDRAKANMIVRMNSDMVLNPSNVQVEVSGKLFN